LWAAADRPEGVPLSFAKSQRRVAIVCAIALVLLSGCFNRRIHTPFNPDDVRHAQGGSAEAYREFDYEVAPIQVDNHDLGERGPYTTKHLAFPSHGDNGQEGNLVTIEYYKSALPGKKTLVIVLPIWGSYTYPSRKITKGLVERFDGRVNVMNMLGESYLLDWDAVGQATDEASFTRVARRNAERLRTAIIDIRRLLDWVETQPEIDQERIALVGFSLGAVISGVLANLDDRISTAVLVMGAAHPEELIAHCPGRTEDAREAVLARFGWTVEEYEARIDELFGFLDPEDFELRIEPSQVLMFDAHHDDCMPRTARDALWEAMGRPERISLLYRHKRAFLAMTPLGSNYVPKTIYDFLDRALLSSTSDSTVQNAP
jgi:dienelactone hydrolase